jgi:hypothetical protein
MQQARDIVFRFSGIVGSIGIVTILMIAGNVYAEGTITVQPVLYRIFYYIVNPLITLAFIFALAYFFYGVILFIKQRDSSAEDANQGKQHLLYGTIGLFIMVSAFAIARIMRDVIPQQTTIKDLPGRVELPV